jgi:hypothetical protein
LACEPSQLPCASCVRPQPQALRTGAGAGFACEPSQKPPASLVLPQPQRLRAGAGEEGTWDMVKGNAGTGSRASTSASGFPRETAACFTFCESCASSRPSSVGHKKSKTHTGGVGTVRPGSAGRLRPLPRHPRHPRNPRFKSPTFRTAVGRHELHMVRGERPRLHQGPPIRVSPCSSVVAPLRSGLETLREPEAGGPEQRFGCGGAALGIPRNLR